jgi:hypothetical protein
LREPFD